MHKNKTPYSIWMKF